MILRVPCSGTVGPRKERFDCSGAAHVTLVYTEARRREGTAARLEGNRRDWRDVEGRLLVAPPRRQVVAAVAMDNLTHAVLKLYEKELGRGVAEADSAYRALALAFFYRVAGAVTEDWLGCPALRHFVSESLETLGTVVVSGSRGQAPQLLDTLVR